MKKDTNPQDCIRKAEREAFCRFCDKVIRKGETMFSFYSWRNRGQNIHICLDCIEKFKTLDTSIK